MCIAEELLAFIEESPTAFHAAAAAGKRLTAQGYQQLSEHEKWHLEAGGRYYVMRNDSSVIAFRIPKECKIPQEGLKNFFVTPIQQEEVVKSSS